MVSLGFKKETIRLGKWQWYGPCTPWLCQMSKSISLWSWKQRELGWRFHCVFSIATGDLSLTHVCPILIQNIISKAQLFSISLKVMIKITLESPQRRWRHHGPHCWTLRENPARVQASASVPLSAHHTAVLLPNVCLLQLLPCPCVNGAFCLSYFLGHDVIRPFPAAGLPKTGILNNFHLFCHCLCFIKSILLLIST